MKTPLFKRSLIAVIIVIAFIAGFVGYSVYQNRIITTEYYIVDYKGNKAQVATTEHKATNPESLTLYLDTDHKTYKDIDPSTAQLSIRMTASYITEGNLSEYDLKHRELNSSNKPINNDGKYIVNTTDGKSYIASK